MQKIRNMEFLFLSCFWTEVCRSPVFFQSELADHLWCVIIGCCVCKLLSSDLTQLWLDFNFVDKYWSVLQNVQLLGALERFFLSATLMCVSLAFLDSSLWYSPSAPTEMNAQKCAFSVLKDSGFTVWQTSCYLLTNSHCFNMMHHHTASTRAITTVLIKVICFHCCTLAKLSL